MADTNPPYQFRIKPDQKQALLKQVAEAVAPLYFITWEQLDGEDLLLSVIPASSEKRIQSGLSDLQSKVETGSYASGSAEPEMEV